MKPQVGPNLYVFVMNTKEDIVKNVGNRAVFLQTTTFLCVHNKHIPDDE